MAGALFVATSVSVASCRFDAAYRDTSETTGPLCTQGVTSCRGHALSVCEGSSYRTLDDCAGRGEVCVPSLLRCAACVPGEGRCSGNGREVCGPDGTGYAALAPCDARGGEVCRAGQCINLCSEAAELRSNVGCEYWAADLDNAMVSTSLNAAAQQYAIVVSNVQEDVAAVITIEQDDGTPGGEHRIAQAASYVVSPRSLEVFRLGPREVDGSAPGTFNTGTHTALSRAAYKLTSSVPIVAYQFNPLDNVNVFSNDASLLLPRTALNDGGGRSYVVASWPQTIAISDVPEQNFGTNLRAFLTIIGTTDGTTVRFRPAARIVPGGPFPNGVEKGVWAEAKLDAFDVLNLETGSFGADFTGTLIDADRAVSVFTGSEASDAPMFDTLAKRSCCADHLEEQVVPIRTVGKNYAAARMPNRSKAVAAAGASVAYFDEPEYFRVVAAGDGQTSVQTTLPAPDDRFEFTREGDSRILTVTRDFLLSSTAPVLLVSTQASQEAAGIVRGLPGGDPSLVYLPPIEQWRREYVLLTPDKYAFDFLVIVAPRGALVYIDGLPLGPSVCEVGNTDGTDMLGPDARASRYETYRCQLSFPVIDPTKTAPSNLLPGFQNDGVHTVVADMPVGVIVYGFDSFVSYGYAGGTDLADLTPK